MKFFFEQILGSWVSKEPAWLADYRNVNFLVMQCLMSEKSTKKCRISSISSKLAISCSFLWISQQQCIILPKILHFCTQLFKPVFLIPMNPRFVTKKFSPLFRGVHFFRGLEAVLNIKILSQNFYLTLIWLIGMGKTCFQICLSQKLFSEQP